MRRPILLVSGLFLFVLISISLTWQTKLTRAQTEATPSTSCCGGEAPRQLEFPYYSLRDGFNSTLLLVSGSPKPLEFVLAVHGRTGQTLLAPGMTIQPQEKLPIDVATLLASLSADVTGDFEEGSISVYFSGTIMPLAGQLTMSNPTRRMIFESEMVDNSPGLGLLPPVLNAVWWGLGGGREARIMVTNTSGEAATADVFLDFQGEWHESAPLVFAPHETKALSIAELLGDLKMSPAQVPEGGITIVPRGPNPALVAQGRITDPATGFSTTLNFLDPSLQRANALHASGVPIGLPSKDSPYAGLGTFVPHVVVRNLAGTRQSVTLTVEYPGPEGPQQLDLASIPLAPYSTEDVCLNSAFSLLPLPLPYCSVRVKYSGAPGTVIGEVSSVEAKGDLVIDASRLANEGDDWAGAGAHPWHLDEETESVLFLTNMSEQETGIGFQVQAGGVHYHLTDLRLQPRETRAIDMRKLRDAQKPDLFGNTIPSVATDGSVLWIRFDHVPVMGRLLVLRRQQGIASLYSCGSCPCAASYFSMEVIRPTGLVNIAGNEQYDVKETRQDCNGCKFYVYSRNLSDWCSSLMGVATVNDTTQKGLVTGIDGGTSTITAVLHTTTYYYIPYQGCQSQPVTHSDSDSVGVVEISGPQTVWWFNGQTPSGYATTITLTAQPSGASSYSWSLLAGSDKAALQNQSGNTIQVRSNDLSTSTNDVTVQATVTTAGGTKSATRTLTVRGPRLLTYSTRIDSEDPEFGYASHIFYKIRDNLNELLPLPIGFNEKWTTGMVNDYAGTNWTRGPEIGATTSNSELDDLIQGQGLGGSPIPVPVAPQYPFGTTKVQHWGQEHRVGNTAPGTGARVQINTFQKYRDHASHESIQSPAP
jgi:hypothetical protein